jgi:putative ABC transport system permease protein
VLALTFRGLSARKLRTALTAISIVLGVALVAGTFILTDSINRSFDRIFATGASGYDVAVTPREVVKSDNVRTPPMSEALVARTQAVAGVRRAIGQVFSQAVIYDKQGRRLSTHAPNFVASASPPPFDPFRYVHGRPPSGPDQVALDQHTASTRGFHLGDRVAISGQAPLQRFRVVGIAKYGNVDSLAGASVAVLTLREAQRVAGEPGRVDGIDVITQPGVKPEVVVRRLRGALPSSVTIRTAKAQAEQQARDIKDNFGFLTTALLAFAGIALFVGGFMIFNTFSITVAQRMREFALLRTLGASRGQVLRSVVVEALLVGFGASLLGLAAGFGLAPALNALFKAFGGSLPQQGLVFEGRTAIVSLVVGTAITVVSSLLPALRATRVPPIAALREGAVLPPGRHRRWRTPSAVGLVVIGVGIIVAGLVGGGSGGKVAGLLGAGAVIVFLGVGMLSSQLVRPLASLVGRPIERLSGLTGRLARENAIRNPGRTAVTAAALMIGLALVTFVTIFAAGTRGSVNDAVDQTFHDSDLVIQNTDNFSTFSGSVDEAVDRVPGVAFATALLVGSSRIRGVSGSADVVGLDPRLGSRVFTLRWKKGSQRTLATLGPRDAVMDSDWASGHGLRLGQRVHVLTSSSRRITLTIRGLYKDRLDFGSDYIVPAATLTADYGIRDQQLVMVKYRPGADPARVKAAVNRVIDADFPDVKAYTLQGLKDNQAKQINQLLGLIYVLLSLSVIVSLFGIVNTLALSIHERTRELGMLRAIGTSRRQVRSIVRYESVITALIGAVLGMALGVCFAAIISRPLAGQGFTLEFPIPTLVLLLVLAALAGVVAAIGPARRAARLNVLEALAYE